MKHLFYFEWLPKKAVTGYRECEKWSLVRVLTFVLFLVENSTRNIKAYMSNKDALFSILVLDSDKELELGHWTKSLKIREKSQIGEKGWVWDIQDTYKNQENAEKR